MGSFRRRSRSPSESPKVPSAPSDFLSFQLSIEGLMGGHSGVEIHEERGNAIVFLASILDALQNSADCRVVSMQGGDKHNAIPREAFATVLISPEAMADAQIIGHQPWPLD